MSEQNIAVIRDQYAAVNERDFERAMSHYAEDVEMVIPAGGIRSGTFTGIDAVGRWFGEWFSSFDDDAHFEITDLRELDDGRVRGIADHRARGRTSGVEVRGKVIWTYRLRDGKIAHFEAHEHDL